VLPCSATFAVGLIVESSLVSQPTNGFELARSAVAWLQADRAGQVVAHLPDLDAAHPLPPAPWFEPGARWSARRVLLHVIAETAQHAGHTDIICESLDGAKSMA